MLPRKYIEEGVVTTGRSLARPRRMPSAAASGVRVSMGCSTETCDSTMGVLTKPGSTQLIKIPSRNSCARRPPAHADTAHFDATYACI